MNQNIFLGYGIEVKLEKEQDFLKIRETLTRMGISSRKENKLYQSCHILHKQGRYAIVHFKELFALDGKLTNFSEEDCARRNTICTLLEQWGLLKILDANIASRIQAPLSQVKIITFKEKGEWILESKYTIGRKPQSPVQYN